MSRASYLIITLSFSIFLFVMGFCSGTPAQSRDWCYRPGDLYYTTNGGQP